MVVKEIHIDSAGINFFFFLFYEQYTKYSNNFFTLNPIYILKGFSKAITFYFVFGFTTNIPSVTFAHVYYIGV